MEAGERSTREIRTGLSQSFSAPMRSSSLILCSGVPEISLLFHIADVAEHDFYHDALVVLGS